MAKVEHRMGLLITSCFIDRALDRLGLTRSQRRKLAKSVGTGMAAEFPAADPKQWGREYRDIRPALIPLLKGEHVDEVSQEQWLLARLAALEIGVMLQGYQVQILQSYDAARWRTVLTSVLHMHINRTFSHNWRWLERCIWEFLARSYAELEQREAS